MKAQIDNLIKRYWAGESTLEEESQLKVHFRSGEVLPEHQEMQDLFSFMEEQSAVSYPGELDISTLMHAAHPMDLLVEKYLAAETSLEEEKQLGDYLSSGKVESQHLEMRDWFSSAKLEAEVLFPGEIDTTTITGTEPTAMKSLVEKYLLAETNIEEEIALRKYLLSDAVAAEHRDLVPMFEFYGAQSDLIYQGVLDTSYTEKGEAVTRKLKPEPKTISIFPRMVGVAATLGLLLMFTFNVFQNNEASYHKQYTEVEDPEEALALTKDALAFLGVKYESGTKSMKYIKELEKSSVFNFKN